MSVNVNLLMVVPEYPVSYDADADEYTAWNDNERIVAVGKTAQEARSKVFRSFWDRETQRIIERLDRKRAL